MYKIFQRYKVLPVDEIKMIQVQMNVVVKVILLPHQLTNSMSAYAIISFILHFYFCFFFVFVYKISFC